MSLSDEEIRQRLVEFAAERAEAQTFPNELFACYGQERPTQAGSLSSPSTVGSDEKIWGMSRDASLFVMVRDRIGRSPSRQRRQL